MGEAKRLRRVRRRPALYRVAYEGPGTLSLIGRPHDRRLTQTMRWLRGKGVTAVVSALTAREIRHFRLGDELRACEDAGLAFVWWPIPEYGVPYEAELLPALVDRLVAGEHVAIHCRMALGRSPMIAAALLTELGVSTASAHHALSVARGRHVPARAAQRAWVNPTSGYLSGA